MVGAEPYKRLDRYAPAFWRSNPNIKLINAGVDYSKHVEATIGGVVCDPVYEAKCVKFLEEGDLFWMIGIRKTAEK